MLLIDFQQNNKIDILAFLHFDEKPIIRRFNVGNEMLTGRGFCEKFVPHIIL
jgi:hypothetical protein